MYFIRHGETVWNREKRKQGWSDSPLTLKGIAQAKLAANAIRLQDIDKMVFLVSPLARTKQFASLMGEHLGISLARWVEEDALKEHCFGQWEGLTRSEEHTSELQSR